MANEDKSIWLTFNGEIYNYLELAGELKSKGHIFRSTSDSEVVIHAYEEWGVACLNRFNGMWGFGLWDKNKRRLFLSRDRLGVKPLYYGTAGQSFFFASEIKALLPFLAKGAEADPQVLYTFLTTGHSGASDQTFFRDIKALPPAHYLEINDYSIGMPKRYWDCDPEKVSLSYDYSNAPETFLRLLKDSIKLRLRSDVPVGTCLSGGLDSSAIVALMSGEICEPVRTFSAIYSDPSCDEREFIDAVNSRYSTKPFPIYPDEKDFYAILSQIAWFQDAPTAGPGLYSQWHVMREAQGKVKVLLDGQGADELLGGYWYYFSPYLLSIAGKWAATGASEWSGLLRDSWREIAVLTGKSPARGFSALFAKRVLRSLMQSSVRGLVQQAIGLNDTAEARYGGLHPDFLNLVNTGNMPTLNRNLASALDTELYNEVTATSLPALLRYEDRNSMAFSIEARTPFLDYRLVEFCLGLPFTMKIRRSETKVIMRQALKGILPDMIINRSDKKGYPTPMVRWLREDGCAQAKEILLSPESRGRKIFNAQVLEKSLKKHAAGNVDLSWEIWRWLTTELWFRQFMDRPVDSIVADRREVLYADAKT